MMQTLKRKASESRRAAVVLGSIFERNSNTDVHGWVKLRVKGWAIPATEADRNETMADPSLPIMHLFIRSIDRLIDHAMHSSRKEGRKEGRKNRWKKGRNV